MSVRTGAMRWRVAVALLLLAWAAAPLVLPRHYIDLLVFAGLYAIAGLGVSFLLGHCGIVSLAQSAFYGIGAYSTAYLCTVKGMPSPVGMGAGIGIAAVLALAVGWPVLRLSGYFLALATLALGIIATVLFFEWESITGGTLGIGGIPKLAVFGLSLDSPQRFYWFIWPLAFLFIWLHHNLLNGRNGLAMRAMRDSPDAAIALGVDLHALKVRVFVLSAVLGAFAGSLFAHYVSFVSVDSFGMDRAINFMLLAVLGGATTVWGPVLGAIFISVMPELLSRFGDIHALLFAIILVAAVIYLPEGFGGVLERMLDRTRKSL